jgi:AICAR transformylase/IMP cyclohydrolase PurH
MEVIRNNNGSTTFDLRLQLAREAFWTTAGYENSIVGYLSISLVNPEKVKAEYNLTEE